MIRLSGTNVERLTDRLNAPVQGSGADGLKLALALLWERRGERPGAEPVLVCHDEVVVECAAEQAADAKAWLKKAMIEGLEAVLKGTDEGRRPKRAKAHTPLLLLFLFGVAETGDPKVVLQHPREDQAIELPAVDKHLARDFVLHNVE